MNTHFTIASILSKLISTGKENEILHSFFQGISVDEKKQYSFFDYCNRWKLAPWIYIQMKRNDLLSCLTNEIKSSFDTVCKKTRYENENRNNEALNFLRVFGQEGIDVAILKGNLFIHTIYNDTAYKKMNDFDMLIKPGDWPKVQQIYFDLGYIPLGFGWTGEKQKAAKFSHAGMSFLSPNYHCITGTQWGLKSPTSKYTVDLNDLWENTLPFDFYGIETKQLSVEYNLLHLILHMGLYKCGVRDCMDVYNLLLSTRDFNEGKFVEICKKSNAADKALFTLTMSQKCSGTIPQSLFDKLKQKKNTFISECLQSRIKMMESGIDMHSSYNDYFHDVEMTVFYFSLYPGPHQKLKYYFQLVKQMFWPKKEIVFKLADLQRGAKGVGKARLNAPFRVFKLIGEEIGLGVTVFLFMKLFVDLIFSVKNYVIKKETYFEYLEKKGIDPGDIKKIVKNIQ